MQLNVLNDLAEAIKALGGKKAGISGRVEAGQQRLQLSVDSCCLLALGCRRLMLLTLSRRMRNVRAQLKRSHRRNRWASSGASSQTAC